MTTKNTTPDLFELAREYLEILYKQQAATDDHPDPETTRRLDEIEPKIAAIMRREAQGHLEKLQPVATDLAQKEDLQQSALIGLYAQAIAWNERLNGYNCCQAEKPLPDPEHHRLVIDTRTMSPDQLAVFRNKLAEVSRPKPDEPGLTSRAKTAAEEVGCYQQTLAAGHRELARRLADNIVAEVAMLEDNTITDQDQEYTPVDHPAPAGASADQQVEFTRLFSRLKQKQREASGGVCVDPKSQTIH
ncbi:MAG: hypothetical protein U5J62_06380 [Desulfurivibrio sp.]|nr:hypothetical protein [Desulfurivibrio sp.]